MKYFFDTEFIEDGKTIELVSIGIVSEDGRELYREIAEADLSRGDAWFQENVVKHLDGFKTSRDAVRSEIVNFVGDKPIFVAHYAAYDWVGICQTLFGRMIDLPKNWPMFCLDTRQFIYCLQEAGVAVQRPVQVGQEHNALADARFVRDLWSKLETYYRRLIMFNATIASDMP